MPRHNSPLRYPGGKAFFSKFLAHVIETNELQDGVYVEPFAGGAGAAIELLLAGYVSELKLNDANHGVYSFWMAATRHADDLCRLIYNTPVNLDIREKQRQVLQNSERYSHIEVGFAFFFLNRTNRSGVIDGGPIGGYSQNGRWKLNARFNKSNLCSRIKRISLFRNKITVHNSDAIDFMKSCLSRHYLENNKVLVYLDPPYYTHGRRLYMDFYDDKDHKKLSDFVKWKLRCKWIMSYDDTANIRDLYAGLRQKRLQILYSASSATKGSELMIFSKDIQLPDNYEKMHLSFLSKKVSSGDMEAHP